jgi:hypothetical protein
LRTFVVYCRCRSAFRIPIGESVRRGESARAFPWIDIRSRYLPSPAEHVGDETVVGIESHIVSRKDDPSVARSVSLLSDDERGAALIEDRHGFENLVIMCPTHSRLVDTPAQDRSVAWMVEVKANHEAAVAARKSPGDLQREADVLWYLGIAGEWESRARLDDWEHWVGRWWRTAIRT